MGAHADIDISYGPLGKWSADGGYRIDGSKVMFWGFKKQANAAADSIGWPQASIERVHTRFSHGYALVDSRFGGLSAESFRALYVARNGEPEAA